MNVSLTADKLAADELLNLLGAAQASDFTERRHETRHPYFAPVSVRSTDGRRKVLSAFSREISHGGIGLLHNMPIPGGTVAEIAINSKDAATTKTAECVWCRPAGEGWYLSGWRFVVQA